MTDKRTTIENRLSEEIDKANFNFLEIQGFMTTPRLALIAGAAIGYRLGLDDCIKLLETKK